jgi:peptidoglycan-associated lipoprotein
MLTRCSHLAVFTLLVTAVVLSGCAKRPATTQAAAPAPTGAASSTASTPSGTELADIFFDFDKYDIRSGDAKTLDTNANWLKSNPNHLVLIEGHCDERGTNEYNLALGERRAKSTMNYLVSQGVQANRITIISYGEERPQCTEHSEACWSKNRRSHFLVKPR